MLYSYHILNKLYIIHIINVIKIIHNMYGGLLHTNNLYKIPEMPPQDIETLTGLCCKLIEIHYG